MNIELAPTSLFVSKNRTIYTPEPPHHPASYATSRHTVAQPDRTLS